jgi:prepilin-type N-terminal cleavage/methylation domain-containing protein
MRSRLRNSSGFTLIEILVVVVILGIASAIVIPQIGSRDDINTATAARAMMADLNYAQNLAIAKQKAYYVRFYGQNYSVCDSSALVPIDHPLKPALNGGKYIVTFGDQAVPTPSGVTPGLEHVSLKDPNFNGQTILGFDEMGQPFSYDTLTSTATTMTSAGTVELQSGSTTLTISVQPFTGEATVQ